MKQKQNKLNVLILIFSLLAFEGSTFAADKTSKKQVRTDSAVSTKSKRNHMIHHIGIEGLINQADISTNRRFEAMADYLMEDSDSKSGYGVTARIRLKTGDEAGFDGRIVGDVSYQKTEISSAYGSRSLKLSHSYLGLALGVGVEYLFSDYFVPYFEVSLLFNSLLNKVTAVSSFGETTSNSDFENGSGLGLIGISSGGAFGVDVKIYGPWTGKVHYESWQNSAGRSGGLNLGAAYDF